MDHGRTLVDGDSSAENFFRNGHSHGDSLSKVSLKSPHRLQRRRSKSEKER